MDPLDPYRCENIWFELKQEFGEEGARKELARLLREAADLVEKDGYPDVFGCELPQNREFCKDGHPMSTISVTLSLPWPG